MPVKSFASAFATARRARLDRNLPTTNGGGVELQVFFAFPPAQFDAPRQSKRSAARRDRFNLSETSRKKMSLRQDKLPCSWSRWPRAKRTRRVKANCRTAWLFISSRKTAVFCARRSDQEKIPAFDRVLSVAGGIAPSTVFARRRVPLIFQRIGLADGTEDSRARPQNVNRRFPTSVR